MRNTSETADAIIMYTFRVFYKYSSHNLNLFSTDTRLVV